jgi:hypothetical protein
MTNTTGGYSMNEQITCLLADTLAPGVAILKKGMPASGEYRDRVFRIVSECEDILARLSRTTQIDADELGTQFSRISQEIEAAIGFIMDRMENTRHRLRSQANRRKLEGAYNARGIRENVYSRR